MKCFSVIGLHIYTQWGERELVSSKGYFKFVCGALKDSIAWYSCIIYEHSHWFSVDIVSWGMKSLSQSKEGISALEQRTVLDSTGLSLALGEQSLVNPSVQSVHIKRDYMEDWPTAMKQVREIPQWQDAKLSDQGYQASAAFWPESPGNCTVVEPQTIK